MHAEPVTDPIADHGEGPVWWPAWGLRWVDLLAGDVLTLDDSDNPTRRHVGDVAAIVRPRAGGGMLVALERTIALYGPDDERERVLPELWSDPGVRMNDGGCDPHGRFYAGSMAYAETPGTGTLYRVATDGTVTVAVGSVTISNGLAWSPDGATVYYNDTPTGRVDAFDYVDGELTGRRPFATIDGPGAPDGLCVDAEGHVWVALWDGHAVVRFDPGGREVGRVTLPVSKVTACTFGGPALDRLYITTSRKGGSEPLAGALFVADVGVRGQPTLPFGG